MFSRSLRRFGVQALRGHSQRPPAWKPHARQFSSPSGTMAASPSPASALGGLTAELDKIAPRFEVHGSQIQVLKSPGAFYTTLKDKIRNARERIFLSTLYIGKTEHEFIDAIRDALKANPDLQVSILTDALRGCREAPNPSCASLLATLVAEFGSRVEIWMFHTPNLTGLRKKWIPQRINEGWGLQHMKLYGVDDEIIMSGANLSDDYFTNRQDRYHAISSKEVTDYFANIHNAICSLSFQVLPDPHSPSGYLLDWPTSNAVPSPLEDPKAFISRASILLNPLIRPSSVPPLLPSTTTTTTTTAAKPNTYIYPLAQFTPLLKPDDTSTEYPALTALLCLLSTPSFSTSRWLFTAGYFNIHPELSSLLVASTSHYGTVVTASPWANGFYGSKGVSGLLPPAYTLLSRRFLQRIISAGKAADITLREWRSGTVGEPGGWTYHAKGVWVTLPGEKDPSVTLVGSSNYTKRSYSLDLEMNAMIVTEDEQLKKRLGEEMEWLQRYSKPIGMAEFEKVERRVGIRVRVAMWIVEMVGGAL